MNVRFHVARALVGALAVILLTGGTRAEALDQLVLGTKFRVKDPGSAMKRSVVGRAKEKASDNVVVGNPVADGASLRLIANGGTDTDQTFALPKEGWKPISSHGFKYTNRFTGGAVKTVTIKQSSSSFRIKVIVSGTGGSLTVVPPNAGDDGGFILTLTGGDGYCVGFGGAAGGLEVRDDPAQWLVKNPTAQACPAPARTATPALSPTATATPTALITATMATATATSAPGATATATATSAAGATATPTPTTLATPIPDCGPSPPPDPVVLPQDDPFYMPPSSITEPPGTVLRFRQVAVAALSSSSTVPFQAWQVLYASTDAHDEPAAAVTTLILPCTQSATTPRPLVSYQVAEDADTMICAPSYELRAGTEAEAVAFPPLLAQGWAIVVPDFEGLQSAWTAGIQEAHGTLDGIRAAENFAETHPELAIDLGADTPVGLWGYSGGGHASTWAAELAPTYAPELNLVGVAAGGVAADITAVAKQADGGPLSGIEFAGAVGMSRAYPEITTLLNEAGLTMADTVGNECIAQYTSQYGLQTLDTYTTVPNAICVPWVQDTLTLNHLGLRTPAVPMYIYHALNDELIPIADVNDLVATYCSEGVTVQYYQDTTSDHVSLDASGAPAAVAYLTARFAGQPAPSTCSVPSLPPPLPSVHCD